MKALAHTLILFLILLDPVAFSKELEWKQKADLPKTMRGTAVTCDDSIYLMEANPRSSGVYEYDPIADTWNEKTLMITPGWNVNLAEVNGMIYVIGGDPFRDRNELYNPKSNTWKTSSPMPTARQHSNCCVVNSKIYVIGGLEKGDMQEGDRFEDWGKKAKLSDKNEAYDPKLDKWETRAPLPTPRQGPSLGVIKNKIYAIGGAKTSAYDSPPSQIVEVYDTDKNTWERKSDFPIAIVAHHVISSNNSLYVIGGQTRNNKGEDIPIADVYTYDADSDNWLRNTDLPNPIQVVSATIFDDCIYVIGGCDQHFKPLKQVWYAELK